MREKEMPLGLSKEIIANIVNVWDELNKAVNNNCEKFITGTHFSEISEDDIYIDRYYDIAYASFDIVTDTEENVTWLSENIAVNDLEGFYDYFYIAELRRYLEA